ncbi:MAG: iron(III) transport system permease protein [Kosmotogales bacterium]|nr:iron(III) transport system permease protein [Kosmotogales bacterium]
MFSKKKIIIFIILAFFVLILDFWIFNTLKTDFIKTVEEMYETNAQSIADGAPRNPEDVQNWINNLQLQEGNSVLYIVGSPFSVKDLYSISENERLTEYFNKNKESPEFLDAMESSAYGEKYILSDSVKIDNNKKMIIFVPVTDPEWWETVGTLLISFDQKPINDFTDLLNVFAIAIFSLFVIVYFFGKFTRDPVTNYLIIIIFVIIGIFIAFPLYQAVKLTFLENGSFSLDLWVKILTKGQYLEALWGSVKLGLITATCSTLIGYLFAFSVTRMRLKGKKFFSIMATLPIISPPFSLTLSIILLFGNNGLITKQLLNISDSISIYGLGGLVVVQTMGMFPIAFLTLSGVLESIDSTLEDAALNLRASKWQTFRTVTLPLSIPGIASSWLLVFTTSLADFANPLMLAGKYKVLSVEAYMEVTGLNRLNYGAALSLLLLVPTATAFLLQRYWVNKKSYVTITGKPSARLTELTNKPTKAFLITAMVLVTVFLISLYGTIIAGCFVKNWGIDYSFTLENWPEALSRGKDAIFDTLTLAAIATPIAGILSMLVAFIVVRKKFIGKRLLEIGVMIPFAVPGTMIGISYILAFNTPPILLVGTASIIIINYIVRELPVGVEGGIAVLKQMDPAIEEAAQDLGAGPGRIFRTILLPLIRPAFISSLSYTFVRSMTAVSAVIFLISANWYHMTVLIYNFSENLRFGLASVLSTTLIIIVLAVFGLMRLLLPKNDLLTKTITK